MRIAVVVVALALAGAGALGLSTGSTGGSSRAAAAISTSDAGIDPVLVRNYRILRRPVQRGDSLPADYASGMIPRRLGREARLGLLPALARRAVIPGSRLEMWLEPGRHGACTWIAERAPSGAAITGGFGSSCSSVSQLVHATWTIGGGAFLVPGPPIKPLSQGEPSLASGLVPDRTTVELVSRTGAGARKTLALADGFFAIRFGHGDELYTVNGGHRRLLVSFDMILGSKR